MLGFHAQPTVACHRFAIILRFTRCMKSIVTIALMFVVNSALSAQIEPPRISVAGNLLASVREQARLTRTYDPRYVRIAYPDGDVPMHTGVCSDVVIRAARTIGIDLQKAVHEDMTRDFSAYPQRWGLRQPDPNIDHRRVPNLMTYFSRHGQSLPPQTRPEYFLPGDFVAWDIGSGRTHIGIVSDEVAFMSPRKLVFHNIGRGVQHEDILFQWKIIGHYRIRDR
jgi:uncharacterized protein